MQPTTDLDLLVVGAGRSGLLAALQHRAAQPDARLLVVDGQPHPGGRIRTQRSQGFLCEHGTFAFQRDEINPLLQLLPQPPTPIAATTLHGFVWQGHSLQRADLTYVPWSFRSGNEELVQACRRELAACLQLGRAVCRLEPEAEGYRATLSGEASTTLRARNVKLCIPTPAAARLCGSLDPALASAASGCTSEPRAFLFLGCPQRDAATLGGYGILPADGSATRIAEVLHCSLAFPGRAMTGQLLVRLEVLATLAGAEADAAAAVAELQQWTGVHGTFPFRRWSPFAHEVRDAAWVECRTRLQGLAARAPGLLLPDEP
jgi:protoporphyrinogen oxidase